MKKINLALMCIVSLMIMTSCGGENKSNNADDAKTELKADNASKVAIKDINTENWTDVIASNFGLDLSMPEGWSVKSARSQNGVNNIEVYLNVGGTETYDTFGEAIFAELKKDASGDIKKYGGADVYTNFAEAAGEWGVASFSANVDGDSGKSVVVNYFNDGAVVQLSLLRMGSWE